MISVLIPSRGRPDELRWSLDSLGLEANGLEALVWLDTDDPCLDRYHEIFQPRFPSVRIFVKARVFYKNYHIMLNFLITQARHDWYLSWNDDVYMTNPSWFKLFTDFVAQFDPKIEPVIINIWDQESAIANLFPIVSRCHCDIIGHFALNAACDDWTWKVAMRAGTSYNLKGIQPYHRKYFGDISGWLKDDTFAEIERERAETGGHWGIYGKTAWKLMHQDAAKIRRYKEAHP